MELNKRKRHLKEFLNFQYRYVELQQSFRLNIQLYTILQIIFHLEYLIERY